MVIFHEYVHAVLAGRPIVFTVGQLPVSPAEHSLTCMHAPMCVCYIRDNRRKHACMHEYIGPQV